MIAEKSSDFTHNRGSLGFWIFVVVCAYFTFASYWLIRGVIWSTKMISDYTLYQALIKVPWRIIVFYSSELFATVGVSFRWIAGCFAFYSAVLFLRKKENTLSQFREKVSTALLLEGGYYLTFIPSVVLGFSYPLLDGYYWYFDAPKIVTLLLGVTCLVEVIVIPPQLFKLRSEITQISSQDVIKWGCLTGVSYLFVFWFVYSMTWMWTIAQSGMGVLLDAINLINFLATVMGLLLIAIFGLTSAFPAIKKLPVELDLRRIGATITAFGSYFVFIILLYVLAGGFAERPLIWYHFIVPHNLNLWCVTFLCIGLPLLASRKIKD